MKKKINNNNIQRRWWWWYTRKNWCSMHESHTGRATLLFIYETCMHFLPSHQLNDMGNRCFDKLISFVQTIFSTVHFNIHKYIFYALVSFSGCPHTQAHTVGDGWMLKKKQKIAHIDWYMHATVCVLANLPSEKRNWNKSAIKRV